MKKQIILTVLGILIFISIILGIAYAYFAMNINISNNILTNVSFKDDYNFTIALKNQTSQNVTMEIDNDDMRTEVSGNVTNSHTDTIVVTATNNTDTDMICTYDYKWVWDSGSDDYKIVYYDVLEYTFTGPFEEVNVPDYDSPTNIIGYDYVVATANSSSSKEVDLVVRHYNTTRDQTTKKGNNFLGHIEFANIECSPNVTLAQKIMSLESTSNDVINDRGIRYIGKNPNNFVSFNGQKYRIIGVFDELYDSDNDGVPDKQGKMVKIINNSSLGNMTIDNKVGVGSAADTTYSNLWGDAQLMMMLNPSTALNTTTKIDGTTNTYPTHICVDDNSYICDNNDYKIYKNMGAIYNTDTSVKIYAPELADTNGYTPSTEVNISRINSTNADKIAFVKWNIKGKQRYDQYMDFIGNPQKAYLTERNLRSGDRLYYTKSEITWNGKIGLVNVSDYGYATSGDLTGTGISRQECRMSDMDSYDADNGRFNDCGMNSWIGYVNASANSEGTRQNIWTMIYEYVSESTVADNFENINLYYHYISSTGSVESGTPGTDQYAVRDTFYLKPNVTISGGTGTFNDPFVIN